MKVLVRGLKAGLDAVALRKALAGYAKIRSVELVEAGDPRHPWARVDIDASALTVWKLVARLDRRYIAGGRLRGHVPAYRAR
ncbi:RNA-binding protein [Cupriavidus sp. TMH.W2]|uniref:RNA-binding protein n=1 Tax=Cupriavidus sp. TMH.W2 TaxID=3434465 RepID=UPI003D778F5F